ncbi:MAG: PaaI family thioesterase [Actinomycetota bacterium]
MSDSGTSPTAPAAWGDARTKKLTWYDPLAAAEAGARMSGIEHIQAIARGELPPPPIAALFGFEIVDVRPGEVTFGCVPDESAYNPIGLVHGGLVCTLLDSVLGLAVQTTLAAGVGWTSIEIKVSYLRPVRTTSGRLVARGWVTKPGRRVAFAEGDVRDSAGVLVATATSSCLIMS